MLTTYGFFSIIATLKFAFSTVSFVDQKWKTYKILNMAFE